MDEDEFYAWLESLDPMMQEEALYSFGMMGANEAPGVYGTSAPSLSSADYGLGSYMSMPPLMDKKGNVEPWDLEAEAKAYNAVQDVGAMTVDPALALYGGIGAFDPAAFQPTRRPIGQPLDMSDARYLQNLIDAQGGGYQSYLAQKIQGGMDPGTAIAQMWQFIGMGGEDEVDPKKAAARQALITSLPQNLQGYDPTRGRQQGKVGDYSTPQGLAASFDIKSIQDLANNLFERKSKIPDVGYEDPTTGLPYAGYEEEPSFLTEKYRAAGIPSPDKTYMDPEFLPPLPEQDLFAAAEREDKAGAAYRAAIEKANTAKADESELEKQWNDYLETQAKGVQRNKAPKTIWEEANPYGLPDDVLAETNEAAVEQWRQMTEGNEAPPSSGLAPALMGVGGSPRRQAAPLAQNFLDQGGPSGPPSVQRLREAAQRQAAEELLNTRPTARIGSETGRISPIYDFAMPENPTSRDWLGDPRGLIPGGSEDYVSRPLSRPLLQGAQNRTRSARDARNAALKEQIRQHEITSPGEIAGAEALGRAMGLARMGRTPTNDVLMQRAMGRNLFLQQAMGR